VFQLQSVALLRDANANEGEIAEPPDDDLAAALVQPLVGRGFFRAFQSSLGPAFDSPQHLPISTTYKLTELGGRFLEFLLDPVED
jgi:hypothetical protein